jgi:hypothetical protein
MGAQHHTPEYRAARKRLALQIKAGNGWCAQPICVMDARYIPPTTPSLDWHVAHDDSGTVILGAAHFHVQPGRRG